MKQIINDTHTPDELEGWVLIEASIECSKCNKGTSNNEYNPEEQFFKEGWRAEEDEVYCPKCAKKYLKPTSTKKNKKMNTKDNTPDTFQWNDELACERGGYLEEKMKFCSTSEIPRLLKEWKQSKTEQPITKERIVVSIGSCSRNNEKSYNTVFQTSIPITSELSPKVKEAIEQALNPTQLSTDSERLKNGLSIIANRELPSTGRYWDAEKTRPTSYETEYGSNPLHHYMKQIARNLLSLLPENNLNKQSVDTGREIKIGEKIVDWAERYWFIDKLLKGEIGLDDKNHDKMDYPSFREKLIRNINTSVDEFINPQSNMTGSPTSPSIDSNKGNEGWEIESIKDNNGWEIESIKDNNGKVWQKEMYNDEPHFCGIRPNYWSINSVKRLSNGEVFTIGDETNVGKITKLYRNDDDVCCLFIMKKIG